MTSSTKADRVTVAPLNSDRLADLAGLFGVSKTTSGCYCMWFIVPAKDSQAGWQGGNKAAFEAITCSERHPTGLLAYRGGEAVGWAALGPRSRYARALRSAVLAERDPTEDDGVWLVPCFFVRRDARGAGVTRLLLDNAVALAKKRGARAVEGFPLAGGRRHSAAEAFLGVEELFASCGFDVVSRPTPKRVHMRRNL